MTERRADVIRGDGMAMFMAAGAVMGGKGGTAAFNKWLKDLG